MGCFFYVAVRAVATIPQSFVKAMMPPRAVAEQKKSWGIGARHREQLEAQKQKATLASGQSTIKG